MTNLEAIKIYVKSQALNDKGIHWRLVANENHQPEETPDLIKFIVLKKEHHQYTVSDFIDETKPSLLIYRHDAQLLLYLAGIESREGSKQYEKSSRKVLNNIVFIAEDKPEYELQFRGIACSMMEYILKQEILLGKVLGDSVDFYESSEFRVDKNKLLGFIGELNSSDPHNSEGDKNHKIGVKSPEILQELIQELREYALPKKWITWDGTHKTDGILVVVTESLNPKDLLHRTGVWRGFAEKVRAPEPVQEVTIKEKKTATIQPKVLQTPQQKPHKILILVVSIALIVVLLIIIVITQQPPENQSIPQLQATPSYLKNKHL